jgi:hypothetical protein
MSFEEGRLPKALARHLITLATSFGIAFFTTQHAREVGVGAVHLRRLVRMGALVAPVQGVYGRRSGADLALVEVRADAVSQVLPQGGAIGRRTAAWLLGVDPRAPDERAGPVPVECLVPRGRHPMHRPGVRCFETDLAAADVVSIAGVPCTVPLRTAADLLRWDRPHMALAAVDVLAGRERLESVDLVDCLGRWSGERNVRRARRLAGWVEPRTESFGESWLRLRILEAGFPRPTVQIPITVGGRSRVLYRLDLGWPDLKVAVEYDGEEFHSGWEANLADGRRRRDLAVRFGWHVVGVGKGEVLGSSLRLERGLGEILGLQPAYSRRTW